MTAILKSYFIFLIVGVLGIVSCSEESDPILPTEKYATLELVYGNNQTGITGRRLEDTLILEVKIKNKEYKAEQFYLRVENIEGNGTASDVSYNYYPEIILLNDTLKANTFKILWELGCDRNEQSMKFNLFYLDSCNFYMVSDPSCGEPIDSFTFEATAYTPQGWNRSCGLYGVDQYNTRMRMYNNEIYAINNGKLYKAVIGEAMSWELIDGVPVNDIYDFNFTSTGQVYLLTENHGIHTSPDLKQWTSISNGILDPRYPKALLVEDSVVYVSFHFDGLYRLRPAVNNTNWKKLLINGGYSNEYEFPIRHPNGDLYLVDKWDAYWVSKNSGDTWSHVPIEYKYVNYETEDLKIHPNTGQIYIGSGDASLAILSPDTYTGDLYKYYEWNASHQLINNIIFHNDDVYYLVNYTPNPGIYSSQNSWQKIDIGFDQAINQFFIGSDNKFLLGSYDGIYYLKE